MKCKKCVKEKNCKIKRTTPKDCSDFIDYEDSEKFEKLDKMIRNNKGVQIPL